MTDQVVKGGEGLRREAVPFVMVPVGLIGAVSPQAFKLYATLLMFDGLPLGIVPERATLARRMNCSSDTIDRAAQNLVDAGYLTIHRRFKVDGRAVAEADLDSTAGLKQATSLYIIHNSPRRDTEQPSPVPLPEYGATAEAPAPAQPSRMGGSFAVGGSFAPPRWGADLRHDPDPDACLLANAGAREPEPEAPPAPSLPPEQAEALNALQARVRGFGVALPDAAWGAWWVRDGLTVADVGLAWAESEGVAPGRRWAHFRAVVIRVVADRKAGREPWPPATPPQGTDQSPRAPWRSSRGFDPQAAQRAMRPTGGVA